MDNPNNIAVEIGRVVMGLNADGQLTIYAAAEGLNTVFSGEVREIWDRSLAAFIHAVGETTGPAIDTVAHQGAEQCPAVDSELARQEWPEVIGQEELEGAEGPEGLEYVGAFIAIGPRASDNKIAMLVRSRLSATNASEAVKANWDRAAQAFIAQFSAVGSVLEVKNTDDPNTEMPGTHALANSLNPANTNLANNDKGEER